MPGRLLVLQPHVLRDLLTSFVAWMRKRIRGIGPPPLDMSPLPFMKPLSPVPLISVVLPAYNEGGSIEHSIKAALDGEAVEVLVADGGSTDETCAIAERAGARVLRGCSGGRSGCLNAGARAARGEILIFLHADTVLPAGYTAEVRAELADPNVGIAAFHLSLAPAALGLSLISLGANLRTRWRGLPYGDQALSLRREAFEALGGFPEQPLLEDLELVVRARARAQIRLLRSTVVSSSRRWQQFGVIGNTFNNQIVLLGRRLEVPVATMAAWYYGGDGTKRY